MIRNIMQCYMMFYIRSVRVYGELLHVGLHWQTSAQEYSLIVNISAQNRGMTGLRSRLWDHISYVLLYTTAYQSMQLCHL